MVIEIIDEPKKSVERFTISKHDNGYYCVSIPNYRGGDVVRAEVLDDLLRRFVTQAETIVEFQREQKGLREALRTAHRKNGNQRASRESVSGWLDNLHNALI